MNCFRLEPVVMSQPGSGNLRPLTLACESAKELADWVGAIQLRQDYPSRGSAMPAKLSVHAERPSPPPGATTLTRAFTAPTNKPTMTIMQRRRGGGSGPLSPLLVHPLDRSATMTARVGANPCSSSSSPPSPSSPLSSPSTITLSPTSPPIIVTPYCKANPVYITAQTTQAVTTVVGTPDSHTCSSSRLFAPEATKNDMSTDAYSPTYLQYKKQFRL
ncbi:hypothetical protein BX666DRAFT_1900791 [Dichotomocladium elegans]|nr:hypothetical protein BX666DRAFT_1900791 [Dichotomocladium elegans]